MSVDILDRCILSEELRGVTEVMVLMSEGSEFLNQTTEQLKTMLHIVERRKHMDKQMKKGSGSKNTTRMQEQGCKGF